MNNIYSSKYIFEQLNNYKDNISVNQISRLPFLIRNNGLVSTLEYLFYKNDEKDKKVGELIRKFILQNKEINKKSFIEELKHMKSFEYMMIQKDAYIFSIKLRSIALSKKEEKN